MLQRLMDDSSTQRNPIPKSRQGEDTSMTPLQRFRLIFIMVLGFWTLVTVTLYSVLGTGSLLSIIFNLIGLSLFTIALWREIQQTRAGRHVPLLSSQQERRFIRDLSLIMLTLILIPLSIIFGLRSVLNGEWILLLTVGSSFLIMIGMLIYALRVRRGRKM
jgi:hypothetical protein